MASSCRYDSCVSVNSNLATHNVAIVPTNPGLNSSGEHLEYTHQLGTPTGNDVMLPVALFQSGTAKYYQI